MALDTTWGIIFFVCACIVATSFMVRCCCCLFNNWTAFKFCILGPPLYCFKKTCGRCIDSDKEVHHPDQEQNQHLAGPILTGPEVRSSTIYYFLHHKYPKIGCHLWMIPYLFNGVLCTQYVVWTQINSFANELRTQYIFL